MACQQCRPGIVQTKKHRRFELQRLNLTLDLGVHHCHTSYVPPIWACFDTPEKIWSKSAHVAASTSNAFGVMPLPQAQVRPPRPVPPLPLDPCSCHNRYCALRSDCFGLWSHAPAANAGAPSEANTTSAFGAMPLPPTQARPLRPRS